MKRKTQKRWGKYGRVDCRHCGSQFGRLERRSFCSKCYATDCIRLLYPSVKQAKAISKQQVSVQDRIQEAWGHNPLWQPAPFPRSDPRYNALLIARKKAGLPEIHPDDPQPDLT